MNALSRYAYGENCSYMYRINDDSELVTPGWTTLFIQRLMQYEPPLCGVVGPTCHEGNVDILTHDFVHRTHLDIFGHHYPPSLTDYWLDDWITMVYDPHRMTKLPNVQGIHRLNPMRYTVNFGNQALLAGEVKSGKQALNLFIAGSS